MRREHCHTCELLKELYWLKLNKFLFAVRSVSAWSHRGHAVREDELQALKDESLGVLRAFLRHANICSGLAQDKVA